MATQLQLARKGNVSPQVRAVAAGEGLEAEVLRGHVAAGRVVIPANAIHLDKGLKPAGIGRPLSTKVNANIGTSSASYTMAAEIEKLRAALDAGADTVMDLSTGGEIDDIRVELLNRCGVPFGTVPVYQMIEGRDIDDIDGRLILQTIARHAGQGVDFFTIHAGVLMEHLPLIEKRVGGIVSRGGAILANWMIRHGRQNPLYEMFDDIAGIMAQYDVCFSLGDALRPGAIADATDEAQMAELGVLGELTQRAREMGCQVMVEGPGHVPFDQIPYNMRIQHELCDGAPFYVLGPVVTDFAPGYDHITGAIGATAAAFHGASFLCYVTPSEHLGLPAAEDVRLGVIASRIAAHAADVARGLPGAAERDRLLSSARARLDWDTQIAQSLDPERARLLRRRACEQMGAGEKSPADYCSMCGRDWCSLRISRQIQERFAGGRSGGPKSSSSPVR
jgi:phosphomethylpyrimidine synthase